MNRVILFVFALVIEWSWQCGLMKDDLSETRWGCKNNHYSHYEVESRDSFRISSVQIQFCKGWSYPTEVKMFRRINKSAAEGTYNEKEVGTCSEGVSRTAGMRAFSCPQQPTDFIRFGFPNATTAPIQNYTIWFSSDECASTAPTVKTSSAKMIKITTANVTRFNVATTVPATSLPPATPTPGQGAMKAMKAMKSSASSQLKDQTWPIAAGLFVILTRCTRLEPFH